MLPTKVVLRAALRLRGALRSAAAPPPVDGRSLDVLEQRLAEVQRTWRRHRKAAGRGLIFTAARLRLDLAQQVEALALATDVVRQAAARPAPAAPSLTDLVAELRQVEDEFGGLTVRSKDRVLAATTEPITLEGVELGPFEIRLCWDRLPRFAGEGCFEVVALDPHPADRDDRVTHPHVRSDRLCAGDAKAVLSQAVTEGRLADSFCLVRAVLRHYNPASPHVRLDEWGGKACHDCGRALEDGEDSSCGDCGEDVCEDCLSPCRLCGGDCCGDCLRCCDGCGAGCCGDCRSRPLPVPGACCVACLTPCAGCRRQLPLTILDAQTRLCRACCRVVPPPLSHPVTCPPEESDAPTVETVAPA